MKKSILFYVLLITACQNQIDESNDYFSQSVDRQEQEATLVSIEDAVVQARAFRSEILANSMTTRAMDSSDDISSVYVWHSNVNDSETRSASSTTLPDTLLYIVNFGNSCGYALVSADSRMPGVVAYIEEGSLDPNQDIDNPGLQLFFEGYEEFFRDGVKESRWGDPQPSTMWQLTYHIPPLLTTNWGQGMPYNKLCFTNGVS